MRIAFGFYNINPAVPWSWETFPTSDIFFIFFFQCLKVFLIQIFHAWLELSQDIFETIVKGVVSLISFSDCLYIGRLLGFVCYYCILLLCWKYLSAVNISWWSLYGLLCMRSYHLQIRNFLFTSFYPICIPLIYFSCLIALAKTSDVWRERTTLSCSWF